MAKTKVKGSSPRVNNGLFQKARKQVAQGGREMERVREVGYTHLDSAIGRLYRNLQTTQKGVSKSMTKGNARTLERILDRTARSRAANRRTVHATAKTLSAYEDSRGMMSQELGRLASDVAAQARGANKVAAAGAKVGVTVDKTAKGMMGIIEAGADEAQANANVLASEALSRRTSDDVALIAQQNHDIAMAKLQAQIQAKQADQELQNAIKLERARADIATSDLDPTNKRMVGRAVTELANAGQTIREMRANGATAGEISATLLGAGGLYEDATASEKSAIMRMIQSLTTRDPEQLEAGYHDDAAQEILDIISDVPGWDNLTSKKQKETEAWVKAQLGAAEKMRLKAAADEAAAPAEPAGPGAYGGEVGGPDSTSRNYNQNGQGFYGP
jgi:hypothetical protein